MGTTGRQDVGRDGALHATLDDPHIEALGMLLEAHNEVVTALTHRLDRAGQVPVTWLGVLIRLARSPGERLRMTELARDMTMSTSGLTRLIDRVEAAGHVRREACPEDRRGLLAVLTDDGREVLARVAPSHVEDLRELVGGALGPADVVGLTDLLRRVRDHVRGLDDGG